LRRRERVERAKMNDDGQISWLADARAGLLQAGFSPLAVAALDRPTLAGRTWTDGSLSAGQLQDLLATYAAELSAQGLLNGARSSPSPARAQVPGHDPTLAVVTAPQRAPRVAAVVRISGGKDLTAAAHSLSRSVARHEIIELTAALSEATGSAVVLSSENGVDFASRAAFVHAGATGPFLGLTCLSRGAVDAVARLSRTIQGEVSSTGTPTVRREHVGAYSLACFLRKSTENNLASAASRFGLTRAEVLEAENMIAGLSCKESASRLKISPETVRQRRKVIYRKLGVESCGTAVARILDLELPPTPLETVTVPAPFATGSLPTMGTTSQGGLRARQA
jgi:DNA-binding CsgD family transcriptional regulator